MRIITKQTDYYDHCVGVYGFDPTIVYDRRNPRKQIPFLGSGNYKISICGGYLPVIVGNNECIFDYKHPKLDHWDRDFLYRNQGKKSKENELYRQPVVIESYDHESKQNYGFIPLLSAFGVAKVIPAEEMYQRIYAYLGWLKDHPEIPNKQNDKEKIVAHGFSLRDSFRPNTKL